MTRAPGISLTTSMVSAPLLISRPAIVSRGRAQVIGGDSTGFNTATGCVRQSCLKAGNV